MQNMEPHRETLRNTLRAHLLTPGWIFPCFLARKTSEMHFVHPMCTSCDIISIKAWCDLVVGHTPSYTVSKSEVNLDQWFPRYSHFCILTLCSCSCSNTLPECQPLPLHLLHLIHHPWPTKCTSACTTPYIQLDCQQPDVRVLPIQVPAWDLDLNSQHQGQGKTWLSTLHPGQRGLCHHGQMGTSRWSTQEWPCEVLRLHRKHIRQWDLPTSPCLWAGRHHKEVWQIHWWASRSDMPTHP